MPEQQQQRAHAEEQARQVGWQLEPPRCPYHRSGGHLNRPELIIDVDC
jgi:hypothetical protein